MVIGCWSIQSIWTALALLILKKLNENHRKVHMQIDVLILFVLLHSKKKKKSVKENKRWKLVLIVK